MSADPSSLEIESITDSLTLDEIQSILKKKAKPKAKDNKQHAEEIKQNAENAEEEIFDIDLTLPVVQYFDPTQINAQPVQDPVELEEEEDYDCISQEDLKDYSRLYESLRIEMLKAKILNASDTLYQQSKALPNTLSQAKKTLLDQMSHSLGKISNAFTPYFSSSRKVFKVEELPDAQPYPSPPNNNAPQTIIVPAEFSGKPNHKPKVLTMRVIDP